MVRAGACFIVIKVILSEADVLFLALFWVMNGRPDSLLLRQLCQCFIMRGYSHENRLGVLIARQPAPSKTCNEHPAS